jgi:elongation factor 1 alpha-like protein
VLLERLKRRILGKVLGTPYFLFPLPKVHISVLTKNASADVEISLRSTGGGVGLKGIPLERFSSNKDMGRILLRRGGETIAAGTP